MAVEDPTNCWTEAEAAIAAALPQLPAFRTLIGAANAAAAARHVMGERTEPPADGEAYSENERAELGSYAQVYSDEESPYRLARVNTTQFLPDGRAKVFIEHRLPEIEQADAEAELEMERRFKNRVGDLMQELVEYIELNGGPHVQDIAVEFGPGLSDAQFWATEGRRYGLLIGITWGLNPQ